MQPLTSTLNCPNCSRPVEFGVGPPLIANTELAAVVVQIHTDELRCGECGVRLLIVMSGAVVNAQWQLLPARDESLIVDPGSFRLRKEN